MSKGELKEYFTKFGPVRNSNVLYNRQTGLSRGFGFIQFANREGYNAVISQESHVLENTYLVVAGETSRRMAQLSKESDLTTFE